MGTKLRVIVLVAVAGLVAGRLALAGGESKVLAAARAEAAELNEKGVTYGSGKDHTDCTRFVVATLRRMFPDLGRKTENAINIVIDGVTPEKLDELVEGEDPRIKGVQTALIDAKLGKAVELKDLAPGDLVQYWYKHGKHWNGHAGVVAEVKSKDGDAPVVGLLGAHQTAEVDGHKGGIGEAHIPLKGKKVYGVRVTKD